MASPTSYQRVTTATDYDASAGRYYLKFDGVDDSLATAAINFTSTDKMTVFAGVRKLSDAAVKILVELSAVVDSNSGAFAVFAPSSSNADNYYFRSRGTSSSNAISSASYASPITNVLTGIGDISGNVATLRINGTQAGTSATNQGTGNYGNYPLFVGRRGESTLPFNGHLYSLIIRGVASSASQIASAESYVNSKTGAY